LTSSPTSIRIHTVTVDGRTGSKADTNVTLEPQVVGRWEFKGVKPSLKLLLMRVVLPVTEDGWISCASIRIGYLVLEFSFIFHRFGNATSCVPSVNEVWLDVNFEKKIISNFS